MEIVEKDPSPGTSQVRVQVFRPADSSGQRQMVREGSVLVTWTAPSLGIRQMGPATALVGETITYRIEVSNPGDCTCAGGRGRRGCARGVKLPPGQSGAGRRWPPVAMATGGPCPPTTADHRSDIPHHATGGSRPLRRGHWCRRAAIESLCKYHGSGGDARPRDDPAAGHDTSSTIRPDESHARPDAGSQFRLGPQGRAGDSPGCGGRQRDLRYQPDQSRAGTGNGPRHPRHVWRWLGAHRDAVRSRYA